MFPKIFYVKTGNGHFGTNFDSSKGVIEELLDINTTAKCQEKIIYSNKKETSDFHGTVSFDPVKMLQQK